MVKVHYVKHLRFSFSPIGGYHHQIYFTIRNGTCLKVAQGSRWTRSQMTSSSHWRDSRHIFLCCLKTDAISFGKCGKETNLWTLRKQTTGPKEAQMNLYQLTEDTLTSFLSSGSRLAGFTFLLSWFWTSNGTLLRCQRDKLGVTLISFHSLQQIARSLSNRA